MPKAVQDKIHFTLTQEEVIVNNTVKMIAMIDGLIATARSETEVRELMRDTMKRFIDTQWQFSGLNRRADASGYERISVTATARVPEAENHQLDRRRQAASQEGMTISSVTADTSIPTSTLQEAEVALRHAIISRAQTEADNLGTLLHRQFRVSRVDFDQQREQSNRQTRVANFASATSYGSGFAEHAGEDALGNAQKITLTASVTLAELMNY